MSSQKILVPDMGDFKDVEIIEVLVKEGQSIKKNDSLITLESDKSSVEVPSTHDGVIEKIIVKVGDKVNKGDLILDLISENKKEIKESTDEKIERKVEINKKELVKQKKIIPVALRLKKNPNQLVRKLESLQENKKMLLKYLGLKEEEE